MNRIEVIYARQSVDKRDSISIETQIDYCKKRLTSSRFRVFSDKGYSGKSTDRPAFREMMQEVKKGAVLKIIIYKFDRISRSLLDFLTMQQDFLKYDVKLVSCSEDFDTSTQIGKMILNILMMFAEMERENIQKRIKDNYYARGEKGFYLGGPAPFGYDKVEVFVGGIKTYTLCENPKESLILREIFEEYINGKGMGEIARGLNDSGVISRRNRPWSETAISRILKNPVYVKANAEVYGYLKNLGGVMTNSLEEYSRDLGCYVYGGVRKGSKFTDLENCFVSLGLHKGIVDASLWLRVQNISNKKKRHSNFGTGSLSWLQGLVKCRCGYSCYVKKCISGEKVYRYFYCRGRKNNSCHYQVTMPKADGLEEIAKAEIFERLGELRKVKDTIVVGDTFEINQQKIRLFDVENKINNLVNAVANADDLAASYINRHIEKLDKEKKGIMEDIAKLELRESENTVPEFDIEYIFENWDKFSVEIKKMIAKELIRGIVLEDKTASFIFY